MKITSSSSTQSLGIPYQSSSEDHGVEIFRDSPRHFPRSSPGLKTVGTEDTLTIRHVNSSSGTSTAMGLSKPLLGLMVALILSSLGAGVWGFLTIPGLYDQILDLEDQVDRLTGQVDRLEKQVDQLAEQIDLLETLKDGLNSTVKDLNSTVLRLEDNVDELEFLNEELSDEVALLTESNAELRLLVNTLNTTVDELVNENNRLQQLTANLETIATFLNETSLQISDTIDGVANFLAEQIVANRQILLEILENTFSSQIINWDCAFRDIFQFESLNSPIGMESLEESLDYIDGRILSEFCADRNDFEDYLDSTYGLALVTANNLHQAVAVYTTAQLNYYFPDPGQQGLTPQDWADADYNCLNVPPFFIDVP